MDFHRIMRLTPPFPASDLNPFTPKSADINRLRFFSAFWLPNTLLRLCFDSNARCSTFFDAFILADLSTFHVFLIELDVICYVFQWLIVDIDFVNCHRSVYCHIGWSDSKHWWGLSDDTKQQYQKT